MIRLAHIICPVDFSDVSRHALGVAAAMASWYGARLTVLHVFVSRPSMDLPPLILEPPQQRQLLDDVRRFTAGVSSEVSLVVEVAEAETADMAITARSAEVRADLMVIGTHARSWVPHLFLGSVAERVVRQPPCPVIVVPPRAPVVVDTPRFSRILCAVDFSESSLRAVALAISMAEEIDASLTLLHVVESPAVTADVDAVADFRLDEVRQQACRHAIDRLQALVPEEARTYCTVAARASVGLPYAEILSCATSLGCNLIVMGVHGGGVVGRLLTGSTTNHVIQAAAIPVMVVGDRH